MDAFNDPAVSDTVHCGPGDDVAYADDMDLVSDDCEKTVLGPYPDAWDEKPYQSAPSSRTRLRGVREDLCSRTPVFR